MSLFYNMLSTLVITFLTRSKHLLISWLQSPSAMILEPKKIKSVTVSSVSPSICHEVMGLDAMILVLWMLSYKPAFSLSSFTHIKRLFSSLLSAIRVVSSAYLRLLIFIPAILFQLVLHPAQCFSWCTLKRKLQSLNDCSPPAEVPFVTGHGLFLVCGLGVGDPWPRLSSYPFPIWV